jgi:hypothetical protein
MLATHDERIENRMNEVEYTKSRLDEQIGWYENRSRQYKQLNVTLRIIEIAAATSLPFIATFARIYPFAMAVTSSFLGMIIVACTSLASLFQAQERWLEYRTTAESLKREKYLFQTRIEPYHSDEAFSTLVERVETLLSKENSNWAQYVIQSGNREHSDH